MRAREAGVILINVLVALALGAAIVVLMFTSQENLMDRTRRAAAATQAEALALGAEASLVAALRRDMEVAPETDHMAEPWALAAQEEVELETGSFSITVNDAQARFDLNALAAGRLAQQQTLTQLITALELPDRVALDINDHLIRRGPVRDLAEIQALDAQTRAALAPHVSLLPQSGNVNLNTANETVMAVMLGSPSAARQLVKRRAAAGFLTKGDLTDAGIVTLDGIGFTSAVFDVESRAEVDGLTVTLSSRLLRRTVLGQKEVRVIARSFSPQGADTAPLPDPPPFRP
ncbi:general secretion pathway protein GspK [Sulfitobacter indolifex]|uniref:general secretion pathway protein GspK n=1 Tax=Sulfitobacter indolifex TaxID=225422 RepID=UPI00104B8683|nr:type II secretion system protein GspK [Sulfitobacter indolifex]